MIIMSAMFIEAAQDSMRDPEYMKKHANELEAQRKEFFSAVPNSTDAEYVAYATGLMTARIYLMGNMAAVKAGVTL